PKPAAEGGEDAGVARRGRGPRRNEKARGGRGRPDAGAPRPPEQQVATGQDEGDEHGPHEFQPPMPRSDAPRDANRRRGGKGRGSGGGNGGGAPRSGPPGNFGGNSGQGQRRRDDGGGRGDRADKGPGGAQPDPMKTSFGYIGAETFTRQRQAQGQRRGGGNGPAGGGGGAPRRGGPGGGGGNRGGGNRGNGGGNRGGNR
ncbi:MAG: 23S rRNA pseudouridylate synthase B, partial [Pseudomonadota bacterium]|nr:23S rRNA pseudouridylate synthase B [Pseudomonadota bacterium]